MKRSRPAATTYYAVARGRIPGVYHTWAACEEQTKRFKGAAFKKFYSEQDATIFVQAAQPKVPPPSDATVVYTDGACSNNQDPKRASAGVGVWFGTREDARNVSKPLKGPVQTNQRAELTAIICALEATREEPVVIRTDSEYCQLGVDIRLAGWACDDFASCSNADLWKRVHTLLQERTHPYWVQHVDGHAGEEGNERADELAVGGIKSL